VVDVGDDREVADVVAKHRGHRGIVFEPGVRALGTGAGAGRPSAPDRSPGLRASLRQGQLMSTWTRSKVLVKPLPSLMT
jgi:hypothetical protein